MRGLFRYYLGLVYGFFRFGSRIIWIYVGLVRDVCGFIQDWLNIYLFRDDLWLVYLFSKAYLRLVYGFFRGFLWGFMKGFI